VTGTGDEAVFQPLQDDDPAQVGPYRLAARLGAGGMGKVYLGHTPAGRPVAIKVIRPEFAEDPNFRRRFGQEVLAARRVQGLYTAPVLDSDTEGPRPWLATAYVQGPTLSAAVARHGALPPQTVLLLVAGIAEALQAVHAAGLVHRDLKPSNVLLADDGPRVIDFGIARAADTTALTDSGVTVGTPAFMAPEQAAMREITPATDVFALGQVAAYAAIGAPAYGEGPSHAVLYRIVHEEPELVGLPEELAPLVRSCLAKDPARRPSTEQVVAMCQAASADGRLVRPEQWLPGDIAAQIPARVALPVPPPTATAASPAAAGPAGVTRPDAAAPVHPPTQPVPPAAAAQNPQAPQVPQAPLGAPRPSAPSPDYPPTEAARPVGYPHQPYGYPQQQYPTPYPQQAQHRGPGGPGRPMAPGYPQQPYRQQPFQPLPPKKSKAPYVLAAVLAVVVLAVVVPLALNGSGGGDNKARSGGSSSSVSPRANSGGTGDDASDATAGSHTPAAPKPEVHPGIQLADDYHLFFADPDLKPARGFDDDMTYSCTDMIDVGCRFSTNTAELVLLDSGEKGSLDACLKDTRYTTEIDQARLSPGSQICATTDSTVALITFKHASKSSEPSTYAVLDVTVWRNAVPPTDG
jgi:hypothetical protein